MAPQLITKHRHRKYSGYIYLQVIYEFEPELNLKKMNLESAD